MVEFEFGSYVRVSHFYGTRIGIIGVHGVNQLHIENEPVLNQFNYLSFVLVTSSDKTLYCVKSGKSSLLAP